jgi:hypothetical protein
MPGAQCTRGRVCSVESTRVSNHRYAAINRHSLRDGFTAYTCSPRGPGSFAPVTLAKLFPRKLSASVGAPGPHAFAVRVSIARLATLPRPPHPAPNVRDDREAPLLWEQDGGENTRFLIFRKSNICVRPTGNRNQLESAHEIRFCAHAFWRCLRPVARGERRRIDQTDLPDAVRRAAFAVSVKSTRRRVRKSPRLLPAWNGQQSKARLAHVPLRSCASAKNKSFHDVGRCFKRPTLCMNATCFIRLAGAVV